MHEASLQVPVYDCSSIRLQRHHRRFQKVGEKLTDSIPCDGTYMEYLLTPRQPEPDFRLDRIRVSLVDLGDDADDFPVHTWGDVGREQRE